MELETDFNYKIMIIEKYLVEPLKKSVYKKYYSCILDEITVTSKVLILDEGEGLYSIEFNPYEIKINFGTEFFEFYCQKIRFKTPEPERNGFIIFMQKN